MRTKPACVATLLCVISAPASVFAATYYASPDGNGDGQSESSPSSVSTAVNNAQPGDTVYLRGGTYSGWSASVHPVRSGTASAWITFAAYPGEIPIFDGSGVGAGSYEYIRYVGLVSRGSSGGFGNGWTDGSCSTMSNGNLEYINCIAEGNDINGIAHYCAGGVHIKQCIVAHNGNADPSWSSGVNLFAVQGAATSNVVEQTISFENIDISSHHSDGSGFIADQGSTGATFINNIGFRNGGSCIRITNSTNTQIINNTCVHNGQDPAAQYHDEIFFSDTSTTHQGALLRNNLCIPTSGQSGLTMGNGVPAENNNFSGTDSMIVSATGDLDFHLVSGSAAIDAGASGSPSPVDDIGFDWRCIKQQSGQAVSWWAYAIDYDYIASIGGVAACFQSGARTGTPDQGAYEYGAAASTGGTGGGANTGGTGAAESGGTSGVTGGTSATGGAGPATGGTASGVGGVVSGGSGGANTGGTGGAQSGATGGVTGGTNATGGAGLAAGGVTSASGGVSDATGGEPGGTDTAGGSSTTGGTGPATTCQTPLVQCGTSCVDLMSDPLNCGACGAACDSGEVCSAGQCASVCADGTVPCGRACVDLSTDLLNCGECGNACLLGQTCSEGVCSGSATGGSLTVPAESTTLAAEQNPGCGCITGRRGTASGWLALALGLLLLARRRGTLSLRRPDGG